MIGKQLKYYLKPYKHTLFTMASFIYDGLRYISYSGIWRKRERKTQEYRIIKNYHRLEKSLSFKSRNKNSGWEAALETLKNYNASPQLSGEYSFQEEVGLSVVSKFIESSDKSEKARALVEEIERKLGSLNVSNVVGKDLGGVSVITKDNLHKGRLASPEDFFLSRHSLRTFSDERVSREDVLRALKLASKTPSVCNRQSWFCYYITDEKMVAKALKLQNGNRGFSDQIKQLFIIAEDLRAFDSSTERYQVWVDGGLFSMSLVYALHSLGIASCFLNWSEGPVKDTKLRKVMGINKEHNVITMLAIGYPSENTKICKSERSNVENSIRFI